jgi:hypothetical protein
MADILDEASSLIECKECAWYRSCVVPMRFGPDDLVQQMRQSPLGASFNQTGDQELRNMVTNMAAMAQNLLLEGCPIFIKRLKASPKLAEQIKKVMQAWGSEPPTQ